MEYHLSWWALLPAWIGPGAAWFLFVNVLVAAIAVTSFRGQRQQHGHGGRAASARRLCRSASSMVLDRLRSFSIFHAHPSYAVEEEAYYHHASPHEAEAEQQQQQQQPEPAAAPAEPAATEPASAPVPAAEEAAAAADASAKEEAEADEPTTSPDDGAAVTQRSASSLPAAAAAEGAAAAAEPRKPQRARPCVRGAAEAVEGKAELNARAEQFIQQFRQDLRLQRLNSIVNYTRALRNRACDSPSPAAAE